VAAVDGIERIRFTTSHPVEFSDALIEAYAEVPELVDHLHLPVQSGSDRILALMKRGHTALEYKSKIRRLRARPDISLSSDFIVGFPGETEADFEATMKLIEEIGFDQSFSFIYSARPGTPAADLPDTTDAATKKARLQILQGRINQQAQAISRRMVGSVQRILVTGPRARIRGSCRAHGEQPRCKLRFPRPGPDRPVRRRTHRRGPAQLPARRADRRQRGLTAAAITTILGFPEVRRPPATASLEYRHH
jgi:tRNA-2-methylthio-N6-dimethylallyladenosine synthase